MPKPCRWRAAIRVAFAAGCATVLASCGGSGSAPVTTPATLEQLPFVVTSPPTCTKPATVKLSGPNDVDPYAAAGARQRPGPGMALTTLPAAPITRIFARPPDPDRNVAARQPDGKVLSAPPGADTRPAGPDSTTVAPPATAPAKAVQPVTAAVPEVGPCGAEGGANESGDL